MEPTRYRLYHTKQPEYAAEFPKHWEITPQHIFRTNYLLIFGAGNSNILSFRMNNMEQMATISVPSFMFEPQKTSLEDVEKWCADGSLGTMMSRRRAPGMTFPSVDITGRIVIELSDSVDSICLGGIELVR